MPKCDAVLKAGVFNEILINNSKSLSENLSEWLESVDYHEFSKHQKAGLNIGFPLEGVPLSLGVSFSQEEFDEWKRSVHSGASRAFSEEETMMIFSKSASREILDAWRECIKRSTPAAGLQSEIETTNGGLEVVFTIRWVPNSMVDYPPKILPDGFQVSGATSKNPLHEGMEIPLSGYSVLMTRDDTQEMVIVVNTTKGKVAEFVPPVPAPFPELPQMTLKLFKASGLSASHPTTTLTVPAGYKILSGGARVNWVGAGNLLTASFPQNPQRWVAKAKDHLSASPATIDIWVIAVYDPTDLWEVDIVSASSDLSNHPSATATLSDGFVLTGGGAATHWNTNGALLTASYPEGTASWTAKSKDHVNPEYTSITSYVIGIRARNGASGLVTRIFTNTSPSVSHPSADVAIESGYDLVGGGAQVNWRGNGNLLTGSFPDGRTWKVESKDHVHNDPCSITAYAIGIKR